MADQFIDATAIIKNSTYDEGFKAYARSEFYNSKAGAFVTIGNDCIVKDSVLHGNNSINRRNFVLRSSIGVFTYTGLNTLIRDTSIGNFCSLSWGVSIGGGNHSMENITTSTKERFHLLDGKNNKEAAGKAAKERMDVLSKCTIGSDVWIATNAVILNGVNIGNGAVIGAGSIVTKDVEPYSIVAGVPAKKVKMRFDDNTISQIEDLKWWGWPTDVIRTNLDLIYSTKVDAYVLEKMREIKNSIK